MDTAGAPDKYHAVQFYSTDHSLFSTVAGFLGDGLAAHEPAVLIATESHRSGILAELERKQIDVERAGRAGDLVVIDAHALLQMILLGGMPNAARFEEHAGTLLGSMRARRHRTTIRVYGEMVDVLCKDDRLAAALALESLGNTLPAFRNCSILCAYSLAHFYRRSDAMQQVCAQHTHVLPADSKVLPFDPERSRS